MSSPQSSRRMAPIQASPLLLWPPSLACYLRVWPDQYIICTWSWNQSTRDTTAFLWTWLETTYVQKWSLCCHPWDTRRRGLIRSLKHIESQPIYQDLCLPMLITIVSDWLSSVMAAFLYIMHITKCAYNLFVLGLFSSVVLSLWNEFCSFTLHSEGNGRGQRFLYSQNVCFSHVVTLDKISQTHLFYGTENSTYDLSTQSSVLNYRQPLYCRS